MKSPVICSVAMVAAHVGLSPVARALNQAPVLTLDLARKMAADLARKMAAGCEAKAKEMNWKMNISVVDSGANQFFFKKMDGAYLGSGDIALHKLRRQHDFRFPLVVFRNWPTARISKGAWYQDLRWFPELLLSLADCQS